MDIQAVITAAVGFYVCEASKCITKENALQVLRQNVNEFAQKMLNLVLNIKFILLTERFSGHTHEVSSRIRLVDRQWN